MVDLSVSQQIAAPRDTVWAVYTDHAGWSDWAGIGRVTLATRGDEDRDGVGCIRVISNNGVAVREQVFVFEAPSRMVYRVVGGRVPMRHHEGEVTFEDSDGGTLVTWRCRFEPTIPLTGAVMKLGVSRMFAGMLRRLAKMARQGRLPQPT